MLIKDLQNGNIREYGTNCHDSLAISQDGRTLSYYNMQCGDGSRYGDFRFVMEDGEVPEDSQTPDAMYCECYFNIGGFDKNLADHDKQIRDEIMIDTLNSVLKMIADWGYEDLTSIVLRENLKARIEQMKGEQNERV